MLSVDGMAMLKTISPAWRACRARRWVVGVALCAAGCFTKVDERACFADGELFETSRAATEAHRPDPDVPWQAVSDVCCEGDDAAGTQTCRGWYRENGGYPGDLWQLGRCAPEGYCYLDCRKGQNCACLSVRECG